MGDHVKIAVYGAGGCGQDVIPVVAEIMALNGGVPPTFVEDDPARHGWSNGWKVEGLEDLSPTRTRIVLAVRDGAARRRLAERVEAAGYAFADVFAPSVIRRGRSEVGEGAVFLDHAMITANTRIGRHCQVNLYSYIAHDCVIGDFVTVAPRVGIGGNCIVGDGVTFGTNVVMTHGTADKPLVIGEGAVIGMGAVITSDVPPRAVVHGAPARVVRMLD